jgi:hypothetical protein
MRSIWLAVSGLFVALSASAQNPPIQEAPLPPLQQQTQQPGSPPVLRAPVPEAPTSPALVAPTVPPPGAQAQGQTPPAASPMTPPTIVDRPNVWVPATVVKLSALDKVNAQATDLTINVGQSATFGSLTISVKACVIRPPDQPVDAAAYLDVTDSHPDSSGFSGWMLEAEPSVSMMQHPIYDLRVTGCT